MLKSKLHQARITRSDLYYEGSLTIDAELMEKADIKDYEQVYVYNINTGDRFETYAIPGPRGKRTIGLNGAAARKGHVGDRIIIVTYASIDEKELLNYKPTVVLLDSENEIKEEVE